MFLPLASTFFFILEKFKFPQYTYKEKWHYKCPCIIAQFQPLLISLLLPNISRIQFLTNTQGCASLFRVSIYFILQMHHNQSNHIVRYIMLLINRLKSTYLSTV